MTGPNETVADALTRVQTELAQERLAHAETLRRANEQLHAAGAQAATWRQNLEALQQQVAQGEYAAPALRAEIALLKRRLALAIELQTWRHGEPPCGDGCCSGEPSSLESEPPGPWAVIIPKIVKDGPAEVISNAQRVVIGAHGDGKWQLIGYVAGTERFYLIDLEERTRP